MLGSDESRPNQEIEGSWQEGSQDAEAEGCGQKGRENEKAESARQKSSRHQEATACCRRRTSCPDRSAACRRSSAGHHNGLTVHPGKGSFARNKGQDFFQRFDRTTRARCHAPIARSRILLDAECDR